MNIDKEILRSEKKIVNASLVIFFEIISNIQKRIYDFEEHFKSLFPDEVIDTKVPNNYSPAAPRFILRDDKKGRFLEVSLDKVVLKMNITDEKSTNPLDGINYFKKKSLSVVSGLQNIISMNIETISSIFILNFPLKNLKRSEINLMYAQKFLKKNIAQPHKFNFNIAYIENGKYYLNYKGLEYEKAVFEVAQKAHNSKDIEVINPKTLPSYKIIEQGLQIILDINNKYEFETAQTKNDPKITIDNIFKIASDKVDSLEDFIL